MKKYLAGALVCFVTLEITLRLASPVPPFFAIDLFSYGAEYQLSSNPDLIYAPKPNSGEFNAYGQRGATHAFEKSGKTRILVVGDSVVEGFGVGVDERFTEGLQKNLGEGYEVVNLGVRGYNLRQEYEYFRSLGTRFSPDIVLWCITYNDLVLHSGEIANLNKLMKTLEKESFYKDYYRTKKQAETLLMHSSIYRSLRYAMLVTSRKDFKEAVYYEMQMPEVGDILEGLKRSSEEGNFELGFVFLPVNTTEYADKILSLEQMARAEGFRVFDLNKVPVGSDKKELFLKMDPCHLSPKGHEYVAEELRKLVPFS